MGVYIPGMAMPTSCCECPLTYYEDGTCIFTGIEALSVGVQKDCPIVPVPEHGDLIDYDFCVANYELLHDDDGNPVYAVRMRDINIAPTIIPADPAKEGEG